MHNTNNLAWEATYNVYISQVKEGNLSLFCNLDSVAYGDLNLLKALWNNEATT